jgi:hypothetical protein
MAVELQIALQSVAVELDVQAENAAGLKRIIKVGFKVFPNTQAKLRLSEFKKLLKEYSRVMDEAPTPLSENDSRYETLSVLEIEEIENWAEPTQAEIDSAKEKLFNFVKDSVVYMLKIPYDYIDKDGKPVNSIIADTRQTDKIDAKLYEGFKRVEDHWLHYYLDSIWLESFNLGIYESLYNRDLSSKKVKS